MMRAGRVSGSVDLRDYADREGWRAKNADRTQ